MDGKKQRVEKPNRRRHSIVGAGKALPLQHGTHRGAGQGTVPHTGTDASVTHPGIGGCKCAVPVQKTQDLCV